MVAEIRVHSSKQIVAIFLSGLFGIFLFVDMPDKIHARWFDPAWDLGHVLIFALWSWTLATYWSPLARSAPIRKIVIILVVTGVASGVVEFLQCFVGRYPGWADVGRNFVGSLFAVFFLFPRPVPFSRWRWRLAQGCTIGLLILVLAPVAVIFMEDLAMKRRFPVLADFETTSELAYWSGIGNAALTIDSAVSISGHAALRVDLTTARYTGAAMEYFPGDWREWKWITFSVYNPDRTSIRLVCKINDRLHDISGYHYEDRFNQAFEIVSGWNHIRIPLSTVSHAPSTRRMDLSRITEFNIFATHLPFSRHIFLDRLMLER